MVSSVDFLSYWFTYVYACPYSPFLSVVIINATSVDVQTASPHMGRKADSWVHRQTTMTYPWPLTPQARGVLCVDTQRELRERQRNQRVGLAADIRHTQEADKSRQSSHTHTHTHTHTHAHTRAHTHTHTHTHTTHHRKPSLRRNTLAATTWYTLQRQRRRYRSRKNLACGNTGHGFTSGRFTTL